MCSVCWASVGGSARCFLVFSVRSLRVCPPFLSPFPSSAALSPPLAFRLTLHWWGFWEPYSSGFSSAQCPPHSPLAQCRGVRAAAPWPPPPLPSGAAAADCGGFTQPCEWRWAASAAASVCIRCTALCCARCLKNGAERRPTARCSGLCGFGLDWIWGVSCVGHVCPRCAVFTPPTSGGTCPTHRTHMHTSSLPVFF